MSQPQAPANRAYVHTAASVVLARTPAELQEMVRALISQEINVQTVAPTVAITQSGEAEVVACLQGADIEVAGHIRQVDEPQQGSLAWQESFAYRPGGIRALIIQAIEEGRQIEFNYFATSRNAEPSTRVIDPWRLEHTLVTGWCHLREAERSFAIERIASATLLTSPTVVPDPKTVEPDTPDGLDAPECLDRRDGVDASDRADVPDGPDSPERQDGTPGQMLSLDLDLEPAPSQADSA